MENYTNDNRGENIWIYLPDVSTLSKYFKRNDLIELSKTCKNYRNQLKLQVFNTIIIPKYCSNLHDVEIEDSVFMSNEMLNYLRRDLSEYGHLVKEVIFKPSLTIEFIQSFLPIFPYISHIVIEEQSYHLKTLIECLHNSKYLEFLILKGKFRKFKPLEDCINYEFFNQLKSIKLCVPYKLINQSLPFDIIDSSFCRLRCLTITNNFMLDKLSSGFPSLVNVEFLYRCEFDKRKLLEFISNNLQLKKISISFLHLDIDIINSILSLKSISELEIARNTNRNLDINDIKFSSMKLNYTIKHFKYFGLEHIQIVTDIIKSCKSLVTFEIDSLNDYCSPSRFIFNNLPDIHTLLICRPSGFWCEDIGMGSSREMRREGLTRIFTNIFLELLPEIFTKFYQIKFKNCCKFGYLYNKYTHYWNLHWVSKQEYSMETDEFTLIRASNNFKFY